jgi:2-haloacid dehalogenase
MPLLPLYVFDAYGTLFDVHSAVARHREAIGPQADRLSEIWRIKQLEYTWVRSLADVYRDFEVLTAEALDVAAALCGGIAPELRTSLLDAYRHLDAFPDVPPALDALRARGVKTAILSNGTPDMLAAAVESAGLESRFDAVLSVDPLGIYKTARDAYRLVEKRFGIGPEETSFQSSNRWDIAGARAFGLRCVWINRTGQPDEYADLAPAAVLKTLDGLPGLDV